MSNPNDKTKNRQTVILLVGVGGILILALAGMFLFDGGPKQRKERVSAVSIAAPGNLDDRDAWRAHQAAQEKANEAQIAELKDQLRAHEEKNKRLAEAIKALQNKAASAVKEPSEKVAAPAREKKVPSLPVPQLVSQPLVGDSSSSVLDQPLPLSSGLGGQQVLTPPTGSAKARPQVASPTPKPPIQEVEIISFGPSDGTAKTAQRASKAGQGTKKKNESIEFLPAGSFVRVAMLNGVDAPTGGQAQSNPLPVAFHVLDTANLANKHRLDIRDCRIIASTWGDLSSERMMGRTETLACIINGEAIEMAIKGQVIGEDGKAGVRGRLITKQGQLLANALFAGALSGIGRVVQASSYTTSSGSGGVTQVLDTNKLGPAALGGGLSSASEQLAQYYLKAADKLYPVIETDGGRTVEILITKGAVYSGKALGQQEYQGLLKRAGHGARRIQDD